VPENLERFKESELIHCRWAMLAVVSFSQIPTVSEWKYIVDKELTNTRLKS